MPRIQKTNQEPKDAKSGKVSPDSEGPGRGLLTTHGHIYQPTNGSIVTLGQLLCRNRRELLMKEREAKVSAWFSIDGDAVP